MITSVLSIAAYLVLVLSPVIIPAILTAYHVVADRWLNSAQFAPVVGRRRMALSPAV